MTQQDRLASQPKTLSPLRKIIASRMTEAKQSIPHFRLVMDIEVDHCLARLKALNSQRSTPISFNDLMVYTCAQTLKAFPQFNVQWHNGELQQFPGSEIAIVVAVEGGLSTPVVPDTGSKTLEQIASCSKTLVAKAQQGKLTLPEISGGTFTLSNLGMYGIDSFDAIINPPQVAILALGCAREKPVARAGELVLARVMTVTLSLDHRVLDGADGAQFLVALRERLYCEEIEGVVRE